MIKKVVIVILIIIVFLLIFFIDTNKDVNTKDKITLYYQEKATQIIAFEFGKNNKLKQKISANSWTTYEHQDDLIENPKIEDYLQNTKIFSDFAKQITKNKIEFIGAMNIVGSGEYKHKLNTQSLFVELDKNYYYGNKPVDYYSNENIIKALGIEIFINKKKVNLLGESEIYLAKTNPAEQKKIIGNHITIKKIKDYDYIFSKKSAKFISKEGFITSTKGFNLYKNNTKLLGSVVIKQQNSIIKMTNLNIIKNIYTAKKSLYIESGVKINASNFNYNDDTQVITLSGNVRAIYE